MQTQAIENQVLADPNNSRSNFRVYFLYYSFFFLYQDKDLANQPEGRNAKVFGSRNARLVQIDWSRLKECRNA